MEENMSEVLPCPFCGQRPNRSSRRSELGGGVGNRVFRISCENKSCGVMPHVGKWGPDDYGRSGDWMGGYETNELAEQAVVEAWNKRPTKERA